jgi:hypothetical protein
LFERLHVFDIPAANWPSKNCILLAKICVFIDELGYNLRTQRNFGRSPKRKPAKGTAPTGRGVISVYSLSYLKRVMDISMRKPNAVPTSKKSKVSGK